MWIAYCFDVVTAPETALRVNVKSPCFVGVPAICAPATVSPSGSCPAATLYATSPGAPTAVRDCVYATPVTPLPNADGRPRRTTRVYVRLPGVAPAALPWTVKV